MVKGWIALVLLCTTLYGHKVEGIDLSVTKIGADEVLIQGIMKKGKKKLDNNKVSLISMIDNRILSTHHLSDKNGINVSIPNESYWVYLYVGDQDVVKEGPPPSQGFQKIAPSQEGRAFRYTFGISIFLLIILVLLGTYKSVQIKRRKIQIL